VQGPSHYTSFAGCETGATNALDERGDIFGGQDVIKVVFRKKQRILQHILQGERG
jgi:hypothetical protein